MGTAYIKQLVHSDGEAFVLWHPTLEVYCPVMCDEDVPPAVETLDLNLGHDSLIADMAGVHWYETGEAYNTNTGESV